MALTGAQVLNGTNLRVWLDGEEVASISELQAQVNIRRAEIPVCGVPNGSVKKMVGYDITGSLSFSYINSDFLAKQDAALKAGKELEVTITSAVYTDDKKQREMISLYRCKLDTTILVQAGAGQSLSRNISFTAEDYSLREKIKK